MSNQLLLSVAVTILSAGCQPTVVITDVPDTSTMPLDGGPPPRCGDGVLSSLYEACDDGNRMNGDGCSASCTIETARSCANGMLNEGETCDDANSLDGDGCSASCALERGWTCTGAPSLCHTTCGDGIVAGMEACDDRNTTDGDGCSIICTLELGWSCSGEPSACAFSCGDGVLDPGERCDDNNSTPADGCSPLCEIEPGFSCSGTPSVCSAGCGDGLRTGGEQCDDGNEDSNDGCTHCHIDRGFDCTSVTDRPSYCYAICGDSIVAGYEQCDDGNTVDGDGCSSLCVTESSCVRCLETMPDVCGEVWGLCASGPGGMPVPADLVAYYGPISPDDPASSGPARGVSYAQLCGDVVRCYFATACYTEDPIGYQVCFCGLEGRDASGSWFPCFEHASGDCSSVIFAGLETEDSSTAVTHFGDLDRGGGLAGQMLIRCIQDHCATECG